MVPLMLFIGNRSFGISNNLRHLCAITQPPTVEVDFFRYNWKEHIWSLVFVIGTGLGGYLAGVVFADPEPVQLSQAARDMLLSWGFLLPSGSLVPDELFQPSVRNFTFLFACGVLVGFGTGYAGGCTSGHAITGLRCELPGQAPATVKLTLASGAAPVEGQTVWLHIPTVHLRLYA